MTVKQRLLGNTGLKTSEVGLGCWQLGGDWGPVSREQANDILTAADTAGVTFWDTADVYGGGLSEETVGKFNQKHINLNRVIVTKAGRTPNLYPSGYSRSNLRGAIDDSRKRLQTDRLDLVQLHCVPFDELKRGKVFDWLEEFKSDGLIANYGASVENIEEAMYCLNSTNVASLQIIFNVLRQDMANEVLPLAQAKDVGIIVRLGLASGLLSGNMTTNQKFSSQDHRNYNRDGAAFNVGETFSGIPFEVGLGLVEKIKNEFVGELTLSELALR